MSVLCYSAALSVDIRILLVLDADLGHSGLSWSVTMWENAYWIYTFLVVALIAGQSEFVLIVAQPTTASQI